MKATEFRIGNYITDVGETTEFYQITGLTRHSITAGPMTIYQSGFEHEHCIPLTSEWLERLGLNPDDHYYYRWNRSGVRLMKDNKWVYGIFADGSFYYVSELKYVHQLQNLYFALTGNELELK